MKSERYEKIAHNIKEGTTYSFVFDCIGQSNFAGNLIASDLNMTFIRNHVCKIARKSYVEKQCVSQIT